MTTSAQKYELFRLRLLNYLADAVRGESGATLTTIFREVEDVRAVSKKNTIRLMLQEELITQVQHLRNKTEKPFLITEKGRVYLQEAIQSAMCPEMPKKKNWVRSLVGSSLHKALCERIRGLKEFDGAGEERIQEVGREILLGAMGGVVRFSSVEKA